MNKDVRNIALALLTGLVAGWFLARGGLGGGSGAPSTWPSTLITTSVAALEPPSPSDTRIATVRLASGLCEVLA